MSWLKCRQHGTICMVKKAPFLIEYCTDKMTVRWSSLLWGESLLTMQIHLPLKPHDMLVVMAYVHKKSKETNNIKSIVPYDCLTLWRLETSRWWISTIWTRERQYTFWLTHCGTMTLYNVDQRSLNLNLNWHLKANTWTNTIVLLIGPSLTHSNEN